MGEGDGTVSLLSLGAMCVEGWKRPRWNPAGINITTVEVSPERKSLLTWVNSNPSFLIFLCLLYHAAERILATTSTSSDRQV